MKKTNTTNELNLAEDSEEQLKENANVLGLPRKTKPYRNYYNCSANNEDWNDLVERCLR